MDTFEPHKLQALCEKRIYFGHQSVGYNIIEGLGDLKKTVKGLSGLRIADLKTNATMDGPGFYHSPIGLNRKPQSKINAFREIMISTLPSDSIDLAFFKLCYVDITQTTDVKTLFSSYRRNIEELSQRLNRTTFAHVTTPLTVRPSGKKAAIMNFLLGDSAYLVRCR